jgi:hypothetical protein
MLRQGLNFHTVRVLCQGCGWFRNIAHSGCADGKRALVSIASSPDPTHVLHAKVVEVSEERPLKEVLTQHAGYRDLVDEAHRKGLSSLMREFQALLTGKACPRCKSMGRLELNQILHLGSHVRY